MKRRLNDEEIAKAIQDERNRRKIVRLRQVREQSAAHAKIIRENIAEKKKEIIEEIRAELVVEVRAAIDEVVKSPKKVAEDVVTPRTKKKLARRRPVTQSDLDAARQRNEQAMKKMREAKNHEKMAKNAKIVRRKMAEEAANEILRNSQK